MLKHTGKDMDSQNFEALKISVASPEDISNWSYGEVLKPETINYRTQKPERDGLFDERIFGPSKDYECYCGKYKKIRYKGIVCDKCGVEVTRSIVRRERMGHIELAVPVAHIWYVRGIPSMIGLVLNLSMSDLEKIIYFSSYVILSVDNDIRKSILTQLDTEYAELKAKGSVDLAVLETQFKETKREIEHLVPGMLISENQYYDISIKYGNIIKVGIGAEAIYELLKSVDVDKELEVLKKSIDESVQSANRRKVIRRLQVFMDMNKAGIKPSWLVMTKLPVLPPDLRPMVQLDGGRFAASDLNDLYRRVINRNNRLKRLLNQGAPEVITRNEKRMLQEAVDALIDNNARRGRNAQTTGAGTRKLRSLSDMLRGKQGRFRQNLLGKRVDYSGRSVIVAGPQLKLHQCGLPKIMALELFKPFVISKLISEGYVHNVKNASRLIDKGTSEVWDILERITKESHVLLNRAPTLHRLGIQAFQPILIEGKAIQVHPLVCYAYNADFDGDQMAVHVPLSEQSKWEAANIMESAKNLLKPASGEPVVQARYDIVFGCFYLTRYRENAKGENKVFANKNEAILAYDMDIVDVRAKVKIRINDEMIETSVGRVLFNNILPDDMPYLNDVMDNKKLKSLVNRVYSKHGIARTAQLVDDIKDIGFHYAAISGLTISMGDVYSPPEKDKIISEANKEVEVIEKQYRRGLVTEEEKNANLVELWQAARGEIEKHMIEGYDKESPIYLTVSSGSRGSFGQVIQMGGMKGLVVNPSGEIISLPIKSNFKEGLNVYEYFISTHGARKGKSDTSLRTADAGYLTRRLVDVSQDIVVSSSDCKTNTGILIKANEGQEMAQTFAERIVDRTLVKPVIVNDKTAFKAGDVLTQEVVDKLEELKVDEVEVRSPMGCISPWGICQQCYGTDLSTGKLVEQGEAVGVVAAQAIGEPGTQLTMTTFHLGGVSKVGGDITSGLPRVEELFEARIPKHPAVISEISGEVTVKEQKDLISVTVLDDKTQTKMIQVPDDAKIDVKVGDKVMAKQVLVTKNEKAVVRADFDGIITSIKNGITIESNNKSAVEYTIPATSTLLVKTGDHIEKGDLITNDHINITEALELKGAHFTQSYIINEVQKIYGSQGQNIHDKHIEIIVRQMLSKVKITDRNSLTFLQGQIVDKNRVIQENEQLVKEKKKPIGFEQIILGISRIAIKSESFLSAASFQETTPVLLAAAMEGKIDPLKGLKENVIIGRLIPAGTGFKGIGE
jgi:DNA-directed RNA polymerase subunit beta'